MKNNCKLTGLSCQINYKTRVIFLDFHIMGEMMSNCEDDHLLVEEDEPIDGSESVDEEVEITEYDITASPNDFNIRTIFDFIGSGSVIIPSFQRNYVWDITRASKLNRLLSYWASYTANIPLMKSLRMNYLVIDGQQRLMTIYYFIQGRFPLRQIKGMN